MNRKIGTFGPGLVKRRFLVEGAGKMCEMKQLTDSWHENMQDTVKNIELVAKQIESFRKSMQDNVGPISEILDKNIYRVIDYWTGDTYLGKRKDARLQKAFQSFFDVFYQFLLACKKSSSKELRGCAKNALYKGTLYRYLGSIDYGHGKIEPEYNSLWVSWSKNKKNYYMEEKLRGVMTHITCHTENPVYGIDLESLGISRGDEAEVVYPMVKENIDDIKYWGRLSEN